MDRTIPKNIRLKASIKRWVPAAVVAAAVIIGIIWLMFWLREGVREQDLDLRTADIGEIRSAITTNGKIIPAFEEIIVSPVNTRILEVYVHEGDSVAACSPLLRLDIEDARNHYQRMADELQMKQSEIHSQSLSDETLLTDLEMKIKTKELAVDQLKEEYNSEQRLDSIGSGTGERVRQARLAWQTATLELQQMRRQLAN
ncbi:MAG: HlyD family secretion protein, partial [Muribaculaceae bacterium]|nr:HlyD family secretion protein [Muribaculaceae bacterium]